MSHVTRPRNSLLWSLALIVCALCAAPQARADVVQHSGTISAQTTWAADDVHLVTGDITVNAGVILTVEPGTIVKFKPYTGLRISGALSAVGNEFEPIVFTSWKDDAHGGDTNGDGASEGAPNDWDGIYFNSTTTVSQARLEHAIIQYGGYGYDANVTLDRAAITIVNCEIRRANGWGIYVYNSSPTIQGNLIEDNTDHGVRVYYGAPMIDGNTIRGNNQGIYVRYATPTIHNNVISDNSSWGIYYYRAENAPIIEGNTITGNYRSAIIPGCSVPNSSHGNVLLPNTLDGLWIRGNGRNTDLHLEALSDGAGAELSTYQIYDTLTINANATLTIDPGVTVKFYTNARLYVYGTLFAQGTATQPIGFTSALDDTLGGDLGADGGGSPPYRGYWGTVYLLTSADTRTHVIEHAIFRWGGNANSGMLMINRRDLELRDTTIAFSSTNGYRGYYGNTTAERLEVFGNVADGLRFERGGAHTLDGGRVFANQGDGIEYYSSAGGGVHGAELFGNLGYAVRGGGVTVDATGNWWGAADGPSGEGPGSGDGITAKVNILDGGSQPDFLGSGSDFVYLNAGPNTSEGTLPAPAITQGTDSAEWGSSSSTRILYDWERVILDYSGLAPTGRYELFLTYLNKDNTSGVGGSKQSLQDGDGFHIHQSYAMPTGSPNQLRYEIPGSSHDDGSMRLSFVRENGYRATVSEIWLVARASGGDTSAPTSAVTSPTADARLSGSLAIIEGTSTDGTGSGVSTVEVGIDDGGAVSWRTVTQLRQDGTWSYRWSLPADGGYTILSRARDHADLVETPGAGVSVIVDNRGPEPVTALGAWDHPGDTGERVDLSWTPSADDGAGVDDVASYEIARRVSGVGDYLVIASASAGDGAHSDTTVTDDVEYQYRVVAIDTAGNRSAATTCGPVRVIDNQSAGDLQAPEDATGFLATPGDTRVSVWWTKSANSAHDLADQLLDISADGGLTWGATAPGFVDGGTRSLGVAVDQALVTGVTNGVALKARLRQLDSSGNLSVGVVSGAVTPSTTAFTPVSGNISKDTTWETGIYHVTNHVTIKSGATLTIQPGVIVKFHSTRILYVQGVLNAVGTEASPVVFTALADDSFGGDSNGDGASVGAPGQWGRIEFQDTSLDAESRIEHAVIRYGGYGDAGNVYWYNANAPLVSCDIGHGSSHGVYARNSSPLIQGCTIHDNVKQGVYNYGGSVTITGGALARNDNGVYARGSNARIQDALIEDNANYGIYWYDGSNAPAPSGNTFTGNKTPMRVPFSGLPGVDEANTITGNTRQVIEVRGNTLKRNVQIDPSLVYFQVSGNSVISTGARLSLSSGTVWKYAANLYIQVQGALDVAGSAGAPVVFTSYRDDTAGGDTNGDGDTVGAAGDWARIQIDDSAVEALSGFEHMEIRYGGYGGNGSLYIYRFHDTFKDVTIRDSSHHGVYSYDASYTFDGVTIRDAAEQGVYAYYGSPVFDGCLVTSGAKNGVYARYSTPTFRDNHITDNGGWGIYYYDARNSPVITGNTLTGNYRSAILPTCAVPNASDGNTLLPNTIDGLWIRGNSRSTDLHLTVQSAGDAELNTYQLYNTSTMSSATTLTIDPGVVVKFYSGARLDVAGDLVAEGTAAAPIGFTSYKDDTIGGDLNVDGDATQPVQGDWAAVYLQNNAGATTSIKHAVFRYGGASYDGMLYAYYRTFAFEDLSLAYSLTNGFRSYRSSGSFDGVESFANRYDGLRFESNGTVTVTHGRLFANQGDGVEYTGSVAGSVTDSEIFGNVSLGLRAGSSTITATGNWWGAVDGPAGEGPGSGDQIDTQVDIGVPPDLATTGSDFVYLNAGPNDSEGTLTAPTVLRGTDTSDFGTGASTRALYDLDRVSLRFEGLGATALYDVIVTYFNKDNTSSIGGNHQSLFDDDGRALHGSYGVPSNYPRQHRLSVASAASADGAVTLDVVKDTGFRAAVSQVWLLTRSMSTDKTPPVSVITDPAGGAILAGSQYEVLGQTSDDSWVSAVEVGVDAGAGVDWRPVTQRFADGSWLYRWSLPADGSYTLYARGVDAAGNVETPAAGVTVVVHNTPPPGPTDLAVWDTPTDAGGSVSMSWIRSDDDGAGADDVVSYRIERRSGAEVDYGTLGVVSAGVEQYVDATTADGTDYFYRVIAVDVAGNEGAGDPAGPIQSIDNVAAGDTVPPEDVTNLQAVPGDRFIRLSWTRSADSAGDLVEQWLDVSADGGITWGQDLPAFTDGGVLHVSKATSAHLMTGLTNGQGYVFRLRVTDSSGNVSPGAVTASVAPSNTAYTTVQGTISSDTTWSAGVYYVANNITISSAATLTILPGVVVKFAQNRVLYVQGGLNAVGTAGSPIVFTAFTDDEHGGDNNNDGASTGTPGYWSRIEFQDATNEATTRLEHTLVRYGGYGNAGTLYMYRANVPVVSSTVEHGSSHGVYTRYSSPQILGCTIRDNQQQGLYCHHGGTPVVRDSLFTRNSNGLYSAGLNMVVTDNEFIDNVNYGVYHTNGVNAAAMTGNTFSGNAKPMRVPFSAVPDAADGNTIEGNDRAIIEIQGNELKRNLELHPDHVYYLVAGTATVASGAILNLKPGVIWKSSNSSQFNVRGALTAIGTEAEPITFTSYRDDSVGGDTDGGGASSGVAGDWYRLDFNNTVVSFLTRLENVEIRYAGKGGAGSVYVYAVAISLDKVTIRDGSSHGIYLYNNNTTLKDCQLLDNVNNGAYVYYGAPTVDGVTSRGNKQQGLYFRYATPTITNCEIVDNTGWGIYNYDARNIQPITGCTITGNQRAFILPATALPNESDGNTIMPNDINGIWIRGNTLSRDLTFKVLTEGSDQLSTYQIYNTMTVNTGSTLTVEPGVVLKFYSGAQLSMNGDLQAVGTEAQPIAFTSYLDDSYGGDFNRDGDATLPREGNWRNVRFNNVSGQPDSHITHAVFRWGGSGESAMVYNDRRVLAFDTVEMSNSITSALRSYRGAVSLTDCEVYGNRDDGVRFESNGTHLVTGGRYFGNANDGVHYANSTTGSITGAELFANGAYGARADVDITATDDWWGADDGPSGSGPGAGDQINGHVILGDGAEFRTDGSEFSYFDAGGVNHTAYGVSIPIVSGLPSTDWGTSAATSILYDMDDQLITAEYAGLSPTAAYRVYVTYLNKDSGSSVQTLTDFDGGVIHDAFPLPTGTPTVLASLVPRASFSSSALGLKLRATSGTRTVVSEILLVEQPTTDSAPPTVSISAPTDDALIAGGSTLVRGSAADTEGPVAFVELGVTPQGGATTWTSTDNLFGDGSWDKIWSPGSGVFTLVARATDQAGNQGLSGVVHVALDAEAPAGVTNLGVFSVAGAIRVLWTPSADDGAGASDVVGYRVLRSQAAAGDYTEVGTAAAGSSHFDDISAVVGESYYYKVAAYDLAGNQTMSAAFGPVEAEDAQDTTPPEDVTGLQGTPNHVAGAHGSIHLTWTPSANSAGDLVEHRLYISPDGGSTWGSNAPAYDNGLGAVIPRTEDDAWLVGFEIGTTYTLRVTAIDAVPNESTGATTLVTITGSPSEVVTLGSSLNEDLTLPAGVYRIPSSLTIQNGSTLTLSPGVVFKFNSGRYLRVYGGLNAVGTEAQPVVFTALTDDQYGGDTNGNGPSTGSPGYWSYIDFQDSTDESVTRLEHTVVRYATNNLYMYRANVPVIDSEISHGSNNGIYAYDSALTLHGSELHHNTSSGAYVRYRSADLRDNHVHHNQHGFYLRYATGQIHDNEISDHTGYGVYFYDATSSAPLTGNVITGNQRSVCVPVSAMPDDTNTLTPNQIPQIILRGNVLTQDVRLPVWGAGTVDEAHTYMLHSADINVPAGRTLTIDPGVVVKAASNAGFYIYGVLKAEGTFEAPIVLTALEDDSVGSSYNGNTHIVPGNGSWRGMTFNTPQFPDLTVFKQVQMRYGGNNGQGNLYLYRAPITVEDSSFSNSSTQGIYIHTCSPSMAGLEIWGNTHNGVYIYHSSSKPSITFSSFSTNLSDGVEIHSGAPVLNNNQFLMNRAYGVYNRSSSAIVATHSWWGDVDGSGPYQPDTNAGGTGNRAGNYVTYEPYETTVALPYAYRNFSSTSGSTVEHLSETTLDQGTQSDEWDASSKRPDRTMVWHGEAVALAYTGLTPTLKYKVRVSYFNGDPAESRQSLTDGAGNPIHGSLTMPTGNPAQFEFAIPQSYYANGLLSLRFINDNQATSFRCALPEVWLMEDQEETSPPRFEAVRFNDVDGSGDLSLGDEYRFQFSEALDTTTLVDGSTHANDRLAVDGGAIYGTQNQIHWSPDEATVIVTLTEGFTITGGELVTPSGQVTDVFDNVVVGVQNLPAQDTVAPVFTSLLWDDVDQSGQNSLGDTHVFTFDEAMKTSVIQGGTDANAHLRPQGGTRYGTTNAVSWNAAGTELTVTLTEGFTIEGDEIVVPSGFVTDVAGNVVTGTQRLKGKDSTAPTFTAVRFDDRDGDQAVSLGDRYRFVFDEAMQASILTDHTTEANLNLPPAGARYGAVNRIWWSDDRRSVEVAVTDGFNIAGNELVDPTDLVRDLSGNPAAGTQQLHTVDDIPPTVSKVQSNFICPISGTDAFRVTVQFDSAMDTTTAPMVVLTSTSTTDPTVPAGGTWATTTYTDDTYTTPDVVLSTGMDGDLSVDVSLAADAAGNVMAPASDLFDCTLDATAPSNPDVSVPSIDCDGATLSWSGYSAPADLAGFQLYLSTDGAFTEVDGHSFVAFIEASARQYEVTGLDLETTYHAAIAAVDALGNVGSQVTARVIYIDEPVPPSVSAEVAPGLDPDQAWVRWLGYDTTNLCGFDHFEIYQDAATFDTVAGRTPVASRAQSVREYLATGLDQDVGAWFAVVAVNGSGELVEQVQAVQWQDPYAGIINQDLTIGGGDVSDVTIREMMTVEGGATLTVAPGTTLRFEAGAGIQINDGALVAEGTAFDPVRFTSVADQAGQTPARGDWEGVVLGAGASASVLTHVFLDYGRGLFVDGCAPTVEALTARNNLDAGLALRGGTLVTDEALLRFNELGVWVGPTGSLTLNDSVIKHNDVNARSEGGTLDATNNWWGAVDAADVEATLGAGVTWQPHLSSEPVLTPVIGVAGGLSMVGAQTLPLLLPSRNADELRLSEDSQFPGVFFGAWQEEVDFLMSPSGGEKTIFAQLRSVTGEVSATISVTVDYVTEGPDIVSFSLSEGQEIHRPLAVTASATAELGMVSLIFALDGAQEHAVAGTAIDYAWDVRGLSEGIYRATLTATDTAGNVSVLARNVHVAPTPPAPPVITAPADGTNLQQGPVTVSGTAEPGVQVRLRKNGAVVASPVAGLDGVFTVADIPLLEGASVFMAVTEDVVGSSANSAPVTVVLDTGAPNPVTLTQADSVPGVGVTLVWSLPEEGEAPSSFSVYRAASAFTLPTQALRIAEGLPDISTRDEGVSDGTWFYGVIGYDDAGNASALSNLLSTTYDATDPVLTVFFDDASPMGAGTHAVEVRANEPLVAIPGLTIRTFGSNVPIAVGLIATADQVYRGSFEIKATTYSGPATVLVSGEDSAGNMASGPPGAGSEALVIDTSGPMGSVVTNPVGPIKTVDPVGVQVSLELDEAAAVVPQLGFLCPSGDTVTVPLVGSGASWAGVLSLDTSHGKGFGSFQLQAQDALGNVGTSVGAGKSLEVYNTALPDPPAAPTLLLTMTEPAGAVTVTWSEVALATSYRLYRSADCDGPPETLIVSDITALSHTDTPPADGIYCYAVSAVRLGAEGDQSTRMQGLSDRTPPEPPTNAAVVLGARGLDLSWDAPASGEAPDRYHVYRNGALIKNLAASARKMTDNPASGGSYSYEIASVDPYGNASASGAVIFELKVGAVYDLSATMQHGLAPTLSWSASDGTIVGYNVYRGGMKLNGTPLTAKAFTDTTYTSSSRLTYEVRSVNGDGDESPSRMIDLFPVLLEATANAASAGGASRPLVTGFFNRFDVVVHNHDGGASLALDHMTVELSVNGASLRQVSRDLSATVTPGAHYDSEWVLPAGASADDHVLSLSVVDEIDVGGRVTYLRSLVFSAERPDDAIEVSLEDVPLAGAISSAHVCVRNHGMAAMDVVANRSGGDVPGDLTLSVVNEQGLEISRTEYQGFPSLPLFMTGGEAFYRVQPGDQACVDVSVLVPYALDEGDRITFEATIQVFYHDYMGEKIQALIPLTGHMDSGITHTEYYGTAETNKTLYANSEPVIITGQAVTRVTGEPRANTDLNIGIYTHGFRWYVPVTTDDTGAYSHTFNPTPGLAGDFVVWAAHPEVVDIIRQAEFEFYRVFTTPNRGNIRASKADSINLSVKLINPGDLALKGVSMSFRAYTIDAQGNETPEARVQGSANLGQGLELGPNSDKTITLTLAADADAPDDLMVEYTFTSQAGAMARFVGTVSLEQPIPILRVASPAVGYVDVSLDRGDLNNVPVTIENTGLEVLRDAVLTPPASVSWMKLNRALNAEGKIELGDIEVGDSLTFDVIYAPGDEVTLGDHNDLITITGSNSSQTLQIGLWALVTSELRGSILFTVSDTYGNLVPEATVRLTNNVVHQKKDTRTDVNGEALFEALDPGEWDYQVTASGHSQGYGVIEVIAEQVVGEEVALDRSNISITFTVEPVPFTDRYIITVKQTFVTHVPKPLLIVDPPSLSFEGVQEGFEAISIIKVSNFGLKALDDVTFSTDDNGTSRSEPLVDYLPRLEAMQTVEIPLRTTYIGPGGSAPGSGYWDCVGDMLDPSGTVEGLNNIIMGGTNSYFSDQERVAMAGVATFLYLFGSYGGLDSVLGGLVTAVAGCLGEMLGFGGDYNSGSNGPGGNNNGPSRPNYNTGRGGPGCFAAGTPVQMADGSQRLIETVRPGDRVRAYDGSTAEVTRLHVRRVDAVRDLRFEGDHERRRVETTDDHLFWHLTDERWVPARRLVSGDRIAWQGGAAVVTENLRRPRQVTVYNLDVAGVESYFAGGALVHQGCDPNRDSLADDRLREYLRGPPRARGPDVAVKPVTAREEVGR